MYNPLNAIPSSSFKQPYAFDNLWFVSAMIGIFISPRPPIFREVLVHAKCEKHES